MFVVCVWGVCVCVCLCPCLCVCVQVRVCMDTYRIVERFGLGGTLQIPSLQAPAVGRDTSHRSRRLRAPSSPALIPVDVTYVYVHV